ncbi:hypothetical protein, partial [Methylophilus sp.]|uniref:hypothetical protein n=1 Tax=Methylophilus sp. TaxID=29541 RepID=UPI0040384CEE
FQQCWQNGFLMVHDATKTKKISDIEKMFLYNCKRSTPGPSESGFIVVQFQSGPVSGIVLRKKIPCPCRRKMAGARGEMQTSSFRK